MKTKQDLIDLIEEAIFLLENDIADEYHVECIEDSENELVLFKSLLADMDELWAGSTNTEKSGLFEHTQDNIDIYKDLLGEDYALSATQKYRKSKLNDLL